MAFLVTGACIDCVYTSCVDVCPVEAFHEAPDKLLIKPGYLYRMRCLCAGVFS